MSPAGNGQVTRHTRPFPRRARSGPASLPNRRQMADRRRNARDPVETTPRHTTLDTTAFIVVHCPGSRGPRTPFVVGDLLSIMCEATRQIRQPAGSSRSSVRSQEIDNPSWSHPLHSTKKKSDTQVHLGRLSVRPSPHSPILWFAGTRSARPPISSKEKKTIKQKQNTPSPPPCAPSRPPSPQDIHQISAYLFEHTQKGMTESWRRNNTQ
ncbi:hypothetical protein B0T24DRAFT_322718 [Lasiosphaeria ovina]|uniref:Uncharacterized protein n=1 Tax=Lasiosphaeria ovina TaxID=92902 RepID=A0AAE0K7F0_9PEZI|nr:hypothetical protein B0T24DRAFT_322718 [Lasiosphaeria ovina]